MYYQLITTSRSGAVFRQFSHAEHAAARAYAKDQASLPSILDVRLLTVQSAETFFPEDDVDISESPSLNPEHGR